MMFMQNQWTTMFYPKTLKTTLRSWEKTADMLTVQCYETLYLMGRQDHSQLDTAEQWGSRHKKKAGLLVAILLSEL